MALAEFGFKVQLVEYERGWGSRIVETLYFDTEKEAKDYVTKFNAKNTETSAPDWYMIANDPVMLGLG